MAKKTARKSAKTSARKSASRSARGGAARKTARKGAARKTGGRKTARRPNAAFMAPVTPDDALAEVVGARPIPRTEVTKRLWSYIKSNKLQDTKNRRMIKADETLRPVFGGKSSVNMFEMTKLVNKHLR